MADTLRGLHRYFIDNRLISQILIECEIWEKSKITARDNPTEPCRVISIYMNAAEYISRPFPFSFSTGKSTLDNHTHPIFVSVRISLKLRAAYVAQFPPRKTSTSFLPGFLKTQNTLRRLLFPWIASPYQIRPSPPPATSP